MLLHATAKMPTACNKANDSCGVMNSYFTCFVPPLIYFAIETEQHHCNPPVYFFCCCFLSILIHPCPYSVECYGSFYVRHFSYLFLMHLNDLSCSLWFWKLLYKMITRTTKYLKLFNPRSFQRILKDVDNFWLGQLLLVCVASKYFEKCELFGVSYMFRPEKLRLWYSH